MTDLTMTEFIWENGKNIRKVVSVFEHILEVKNLPNLIINSHPNSDKKKFVIFFLKKFFKDVAISDYVIIVNANEDGGIKLIREKIKGFAFSAINKNNFEKQIYFKLIIIENANALTQDAQNALRRIVEDFSHITRFILLINDNRTIIDPLQSRCSYVYIPQNESSLYAQILEKFYPNIRPQDYDKYLEKSDYNLAKIKLYYDIYQDNIDDFFDLIDNNTFSFNIPPEYTNIIDKNDFLIKRELQCSIEFITP